MISELQALEMIDKPTEEEKKRMATLKYKKGSTVKRPVRENPDEPKLFEQMDAIHEKFVGKIEPWTVVKCTTCKSRYHVIELANCKCGLEESKERYDKYIGGFKIGTNHAG